MAKTRPGSFSDYPELELVLCCSRTSMDSDMYNRAKDLTHLDIDWSKVIKIATNSRVTPLLFKNLTLISPAGIPDEVIEQLKEYYSNNLRINLCLYRELWSILRLFKLNDIQTLPYKGPVFALLVYGDLSLRNWGDLDILIHKSDVTKAKNLLSSLGYKLSWPKIELNDVQETAHLESKYNYSFVNELTGIVLELHWGITPKYFSFPPRAEWLWERLATQNISGMEVLTFSPEDYLLILCMHSSNHCWERLGWISDISELIGKHPNLDWGYIIHEAETFGVKRILLLGLLIARDFLGTSLNTELIQLIEADSRVKTLEEQVSLKFLNNDYIGSKALEIPLFHLRMRERFSDKLLYCLYMSNPSSKDWVIFPSIQSNSFIFFILRPLRLIFEHGFIPVTRRLKNLIAN
jgi:hypothetical protein